MADRTSNPSRRLRSANHSPAPPGPSKSLPRRSNRAARSQSREISETEVENDGRKATRSRAKKSPAVNDGNSTLASIEPQGGREKRKRESAPLEGENKFEDRFAIRYSTGIHLSD